MRGGLNLALSGVSIWGHNAGGFEEVATEELYIRWTAFGFFNPVSHFLGMEHPQYKEPWRYGSRALAAFRRYAQLRYRLMPYIYTAAHQTYADGVPMMRPLVLEYPQDPRVYGIDDQYLFGDALMIAPVTQEGAAGRAVYLPEGAWVDYWTGARYDGGRTIDYAAAADVLPIFARAGAIVPMQPDMAYIGEKPVDPLTLDIFPSGRSRFNLYEDDGESLAYQEGMYAETAITCDEMAGQIDVRVAAPAGRFVVSPRAYEFRIHLEAAPRAVRIDGGTWTYDASARVLLARTDPARKSLTARVRIEK